MSQYSISKEFHKRTLDPTSLKVTQWNVTDDVSPKGQMLPLITDASVYGRSFGVRVRYLVRNCGLYPNYCAKTDYSCHGKGAHGVRLRVTICRVLPTERRPFVNTIEWSWSVASGVVELTPYSTSLKPCSEKPDYSVSTHGSFHKFSIAGSAIISIMQKGYFSSFTPSL